MSDLMLLGILRMPLPDNPADYGPIMWMQAKGIMREAAARIEKDAAENEKLRAALKPFAWHVTTEVLFEDLPDEHVIERCGIKIGDLRAARAALKEMGDE